MPIVEYFDQGTQQRKKKEFGYGAMGKEKARKFAGAGRSSGPDDARHHPGVKIKDKRHPKVEKETKYVEGDPFEFDKKSTVQYGGPSY